MPRGYKTQGSALRTKRKNGRSADEAPKVDDAAKTAYECGLFGLTAIETSAKLKQPLDDKELLEAYNTGKAQHAFTIMQAIYNRAIGGSDALLKWIAENNLKRNLEVATGNALIDAMTPEQRRQRIVELTKKLSIG